MVSYGLRRKKRTNKIINRDIFNCFYYGWVNLVDLSGHRLRELGIDFLCITYRLIQAHIVLNKTLID